MKKSYPSVLDSAGGKRCQRAKNRLITSSVILFVTFLESGVSPQWRSYNYFTKTPTVQVHRTEPVQIRESTSIEGKEVNDLNYQGRKITLFRKEAEQ
uniref:Uncharacterized protein n=1 Tax=Wuchereria bancrofti TaxID=6293 RepID=A0A1I8EPG0_WUCBA